MQSDELIIEAADAGDTADTTAAQAVELPAIEELTAEDLTPEQRQIVAALQRNGSQRITRLARGIGVENDSIRRRARGLIEVGLVRIAAGRTIELTEAGQRFDIKKRHERQFESQRHNTDTMQQRMRRDDWKATLDEIAPRTVEQIDRIVVTNPEPPRDIPEDFVDVAVAQLRMAVQWGNFDRIRELADILSDQLEMRRLAIQPLAFRPYGERLMTLLVECRCPSGEPVSVRVVNMVEEVCTPTLGAILERWPLEFVGCRQFGPSTISLLGKILVGAGLMDAEDYDAGMAAVAESDDANPAMKHKLKRAAS